MGARQERKGDDDAHFGSPTLSFANKAGWNIAIDKPQKLDFRAGGQLCLK
jgi:hypothetical protein